MEAAVAAPVRSAVEGIKWSEFIPHQPTAKQALFLMDTRAESMFGGAAGGGKSDALLMGALQWADHPDYTGLILRRTYKDLALPGAIMDRSRDWLRGTAAVWREGQKTWTFPSGARLVFSYLGKDNDVYQYQSSNWNYVAIDELSQFTEFMYTYMFSRIRRREDSPIPGRMRSATNPGGIGHEWVKRRFITRKAERPGWQYPAVKGTRLFVPALLTENPHLDQADYEDKLGRLDPLTRAQLRWGDWTARVSGGMLRREWFREFTSSPNAEIVRVVRYWDLSGSTKLSPVDAARNSGDWTAGVKMGLGADGKWYLFHVVRFRRDPALQEMIIRGVAEHDRWLEQEQWGLDPEIVIEQEGGSSGKILMAHYQRRVLRGFPAYAKPARGKKTENAKPLSASLYNGNVIVCERDLDRVVLHDAGGNPLHVDSEWLPDYLNELDAFPQEGVHDDMVDATSGAFNWLANTPPAGTGVYEVVRG